MTEEAGTFERDCSAWCRARASLASAFGAVLCIGACNSATPPSDGALAIGSWGGENSGVIVLDSVAHVHVGCTFGDIPGRVRLDADGRFSVAGSYLLKAYPVAIGPTMPAQFSGRVTGSTLTLSITVNDTIDKKPVALGPVTVRFGQDAQMGPCPICRIPRMGT